MPFGDIIGILSICIFETLNTNEGAFTCRKWCLTLNYSDETIIKKF